MTYIFCLAMLAIWVLSGKLVSNSETMGVERRAKLHMAIYSITMGFGAVGLLAAAFGGGK